MSNWVRLAKLNAYWITVNYREAYGFHASNGLLFSHEGPTRGETFVTRKITRAVAAIEAGLGRRIYQDNLDGSVGRVIEWRGEDATEEDLDARTGEVLAAIDPRYFRPAEVDELLGDTSKAHAKLGWRHRVTFPELVREMVEADRMALRRAPLVARAAI